MSEILDALIGDQPEVIYGGAFLAANVAAAAVVPLVAAARPHLRNRLGPEAAHR